MTDLLARPTEDSVDPRVLRSRAAILRATAELLVEQGSSGVTIEGIAERSRVAKTTIYRHWKTRSQLIFAGFESLFQPMTAFPTEGSMRRQLEGILNGLVRGLTVSNWAPAVTALIEAADRDPELRQLVHDFLVVRMEHAREALRAGILCGELRSDLDIEVAVGVLAGPIFYRRLVSRQRLDEQLVRGVVAQFLRGAEPLRQ